MGNLESMQVIISTLSSLLPSNIQMEEKVKSEEGQRRKEVVERLGKVEKELERMDLESQILIPSFSILVCFIIVICFDKILTFFFLERKKGL